MAQILYGWCPEKRDRRLAANKEEGGGKREGEIGVMQLQAKKRPGYPATPGAQREAQNSFCPGAF